MEAVCEEEMKNENEIWCEDVTECEDHTWMYSVHWQCGMYRTMALINLHSNVMVLIYVLLNRS